MGREAAADCEHLQMERIMVFLNVCCHDGIDIKQNMATVWVLVICVGVI